MGELKHLSTPRKRNQKEIPLVAASEGGRAQTLRAEWSWGLSSQGVGRQVRPCPSEVTELKTGL